MQDVPAVAVVMVTGKCLRGQVSSPIGSQELGSLTW